MTDEEVAELLGVHEAGARRQRKQEERARQWRYEHRWSLRWQAFLDLLPFEVHWKSEGYSWGSHD